MGTWVVVAAAAVIAVLALKPEARAKIAANPAMRSVLTFIALGLGPIVLMHLAYFHSGDRFYVPVAAMGYGGLFDAVKVKEDALDKLYAFDNALADGLTQISGTIDAIDAAVAAKQGVPEAIGRFDDQCRYLITTFNQRKEVLTS